jgi:hypothetical protein
MSENPSTPLPPIERLGRLNNGDNAFAAALRFGVEVMAWVAIQRVWGWGAMIVAILVLAIFNARGDKQVRGIPVPGGVRIVLEVGLMVAGTIAVTVWFGGWAGAGMAVALLLQIVLGWRRYAWLLRQ